MRSRYDRPNKFRSHYSHYMSNFRSQYFPDCRLVDYQSLHYSQ